MKIGRFELDEQIILAPMAKRVLDYTKADAIMIGRAAQGKPWIFDEINYYLMHGKEREPVSKEGLHDILPQHINRLYAFYVVRNMFNEVETAKAQLSLLQGH